MSEKTSDIKIKKIYILKDMYNWSHSQIAKKLNIGKSTVGYYLKHREMYDNNYTSKNNPVDPVSQNEEVNIPVETKINICEIPQTSKFTPNNYSNTNPLQTINSKITPVEFS